MSTHVNSTHVNFTFKKLYKINNQQSCSGGGELTDMANFGNCESWMMATWGLQYTILVNLRLLESFHNKKKTICQ